MRNFREHKLSRIGQYKHFRVLNFREFGQNSRNSRKFLLAKVSAPKVDTSKKKMDNTEQDINLAEIKIPSSSELRVAVDESINFKVVNKVSVVLVVVNN